jgi:hypothetical protein
VTPQVWAPQIAKLAARFNVRIELTTWKEAHPIGRLNGPSSYAGMDLTERIVWYTADAELEHVLHEIMHIVTNPPGVDHEYVPEDFLLMQFERCVARTISPRVYARVVDWQLETVAPLIVPEAALGEILNYEKTKPWHEGFDRARRLGMLDASNHPTWVLPQWDDALLEDARLKVQEASRKYLRGMTKPRQPSQGRGFRSEVHGPLWGFEHSQPRSTRSRGDWRRLTALLESFSGSAGILSEAPLPRCPSSLPAPTGLGLLSSSFSRPDQAAREEHHLGCSSPVRGQGRSYTAGGGSEFDVSSTIPTCIEGDLPCTRSRRTSTRISKPASCGSRSRAWVGSSGRATT